MVFHTRWQVQTSSDHCSLTAWDTRSKTWECGQSPAVHWGLTSNTAASRDRQGTGTLLASGAGYSLPETVLPGNKDSGVCYDGNAFISALNTWEWWLNISSIKIITKLKQYYYFVCLNHTQKINTSCWNVL